MKPGLVMESLCCSQWQGALRPCDPLQGARSVRVREGRERGKSLGHLTIAGIIMIASATLACAGALTGRAAL